MRVLKNAFVLLPDSLPSEPFRDFLASLLKDVNELLSMFPVCLVPEADAGSGLSRPSRSAHPVPQMLIITSFTLMVMQISIYLCTYSSMSRGKS